MVCFTHISGTNITPQVSVVMSCFNASKYLDEAIASILQQTYTDYEFILIDDGSKDDTLEIIHKYAVKDNRIVVIEKENTGLTDSLNIGINAARGKWIARLDADDVALENRLEEQIGFLNRSPDIVLLGSAFFEIDEHGMQVTKHKYPTKHKSLFQNLKRLKRFFPHSSTIYRSDIVKEVGLYNPRIVCAEDWDMWLRLAEKGNIACLDKPLVKIRKHLTNISLSNGGKTQLISAWASTICHFLRCRGIDDPATSGTDIEWDKFIVWISLKLDNLGVFEIRRRRLQLKVEYLSSRSRIIRTWRLIKRITRYPDYIRTIKDKIFYQNLPMQLADEWIRINLL